ncbi:phosphate/phosphite/phosphonate ABC transporter substrate-binding protein [Melaminivora suipulveris]|nr:PhnD/SsuA/transferrin family substrate-binding protein [Melaminivora suipulveris]
MTAVRKMGVLCLSAFMLLAAGAARAETQPVLVISEGTSGGLDHAQVIAKYQDVANVIGQALRTKVSVVFAREFATLENGMKAGKFDFVMARPSDYPARGMRDSGYQYVANAKPAGQCLIIVPKDSPLKKLEEARGKRLVMPEQVSYMSRFCRAELRDQGINLASENVKYVREQAAVTFFLANKFSDVGAIASYSGPAKKLDQEGFRILHSSVQKPYFPLVAHSRFDPAQIKAIQRELEGLSAKPEGAEILKRVGITGFETGNEAAMKDLLAWLEK